MRRWTRLAVFMAVAMLLTTEMTAQQNTSFHRQQGDYIFGLNGGAAFQQSDVASNLSGFGLGLTYGKNLLYAPHAPFSFDVRTRFQITRSFGRDIRPSYGIVNNNALNGEKNLDYTGEEEGGFVYANHKTNQAEVGLEGVLTLNGLRENTGLGLSFTGGVGVNWFKTKIDQRNDAGLYTDEYSQVDVGGAKPYNLSQLKGFTDGKYETLADGFGKAGKFGIMPSLGVELDYDLTENIALGVGHRVTFSGTDLLDGQRWTNTNVLTGNNDILHYTSLGVKYTFNKNGGNHKNHRKPTIELLEPYGNDLSTRSRVVPIKARVNRVDNPFDVYLTVNGREQTFNFNNNQLVGQIRLKPGENKVEIAANNPSGRTVKTFFINYRTEDGASTNVLDFGRPEIEFINPANDNLKVTEEYLSLRARVRLVEDDDDIELRVNGRKERFEFNKGIDALDARIDLKTGANTIEIIAKNRNGEQRLTRQIYRELPVEFPVVQFTSPAYNNAKVEDRLAKVKIKVEQIKQSSDLQLLVNGRTEPNFYFDYQKGQVSADIELREGRNEVELIAINQRGEARDQRTIVYERPYRPTIRRPNVRINAPQYSQSTTREEVVGILATLENVFRKSAIRMTNNGLAIYDFDFNPNTGILRHNLYLREGINQVVIEAENEAGRDGTSATINFEVPILPPPPPPPIIVVTPDVDIFSPKRNDVFETDEITVKANLNGVASKREIEFIVNRNDCVDFSFNPRTGKFRARIALEGGANEIILKAATPGGTDREKITVYQERPYAPIIDFKTPNYTTTVDKKISIKANIDYIDDKRAVQVYLNNRTIRDFKFRNNKLEATLRLKEGRNEVEILAENKYGKDSHTWSVNYNRPQPPSISFSNIRENQTFRENRYKLEAEVKNIEDVKDLRLFVNGVLTKNTDLDGAIFRANILLKEGRNSVELKAKTEYGTAEKRLIVNYLKPKVRNVVTSLPKAPTVTFLTADKKQTQQMSEKLEVAIRNIEKKSDLTLKLNDKTFKDFEFDRKEGLLVATLPLKIGKNAVSVLADTEGGKVEKTITITRRTSRAVVAKGKKKRKAKLTKTRSSTKF